VHPRVDPTAQLRALALAQAQVVSAGQVAALGLGLRSVDRLIAQQHWTRLAPGIYHTGTGSPTWLGLAWCGVLLGGTGARLGLASAGHLWGLVEAPRTITVLVPWERRILPRAPWRFQRERSGVRDSRSPGDPPRTTIEETVVDLCAAAQPGELVDLLTTAVQTRKTTAPRILAALDRRSQVRYRGLLRDILCDVADGAESVLEVRYVRDVERAHGLPRGSRQHRGRRGRAHRDVLYEEFATIAELDGIIHARQRFRDNRRDNAALLDGEVTLRYGWSDVTERPCQVAFEVAAVLRSRGWAGFPTRCPLCRQATDEDLTAP
jgi:very-short-patch-repair endonuclease